MDNIYTKKGLQGIVNASGRMTKLGVSTISESVSKVLVEAASNYVLIDDLYEYAGKEIANLIEAADACITSSASAGIALSIASLICKDNLQEIQHLFETMEKTKKREVILLKGHNVDFGAPIAEMIQLGGGKIVEVGYANGSKIQDIQSAVNENTLAILFVKSHHCVQKDMVEVEDVIKLANQMQIPCIVDAAAEENLKKYNKLGADFVCYSGAKAIEGPTSGFVVCKTSELAYNMRLQYKGIGRAMKIGKEGSMGLLQAVKEYVGGERKAIIVKEDLVHFVEEINHIPGCKASLIQDEAGRDIYRAKIYFEEAEFGCSAKEVVKCLKEGDTAIYTRDYQANLGSIAIDPRPLKGLEDLELIHTRIAGIRKEII